MFPLFFFSNFISLKILIFIILFGCIASDLGGFIFGKIFKGPKLTKISPNKTYSGAIGSLILTIITISLMFLFILKLFNYNIILISLIISISCQLGDLVFSYLKRKANIKDTGNFLPGHGRVLDRLDGIFFGYADRICILNFNNLNEKNYLNFGSISIGLSSLKIIDSKKNYFNPYLFSANKNYRLICNQINKYKPKFFLVNDKNTHKKVKKKFKNSKTKIINSLQPKILKKKPILVSAIPGVVGLNPTILMIKKSKKIIIANKESIICGWDLIKKIQKNIKQKLYQLTQNIFNFKSYGHHRNKTYR